MATQNPMSNPLRYVQNEFGGPKLPRPINFFMYSAGIIIGVVSVLFLVAGFGKGDDFLERLGDSYKTIYNATTEGKTWTSIMDDNLLLFAVPAVIILVTLGWKLNLGFGNRAIMMFIALGIGFVAGHVFWPTAAMAT